MATAADLKVHVGADVADAEKGLAGIDRRINSFAASIGGVARAAGTSFVAVGATVAAGLGVSVKTAADFEQTMSQVSAVTGETGAALNKLSDLALDLGAKTSFSSQQAAEAMAELAKGGVATADIMSGALAATLDLAAAGGLDLAQAATITADALSIFGLSGQQAALVADTFARGQRLVHRR